MEKNAFLQVLEKSGLEETKASAIIDRFSTFLVDMGEQELLAKDIIVTDVSQTVEMDKARKVRLALQKIRTDTEKVRKRLKEQSLREGKAIDGIANIIKAVIVPLEEHLQKQEKFAENKEREEKERIHTERVSKLEKYVEDVNLYNLKEMSDEAFEQLLEGSKKARLEASRAEEKAEEKRIADEKAEKEMNEKNRIERERLEKEAKDRDVALAKEREEHEDELEEQRKIAAAKESMERLAKEEAEEKLKEKEKAEEKVRQEAAAKKVAQEKAERDAALLPDKEKLLVFAEQIKGLKAPQNLSNVAMEIVKQAEQSLLAISQEINEKTKTL